MHEFINGHIKIPSTFEAQCIYRRVTHGRVKDLFKVVEGEIIYSMRIKRCGIDQSTSLFQFT